METLGTLFVTTIVQGLPALVALMAWGEGGHRILRQFGARMMWEIAGLVAVGVAFLLYATMRLIVDEGANIFVIAVASLSAVLAVTIVTSRFQSGSGKVRVALTGGASLLGLQAGLALGVLGYIVLWRPHQ